MNIVFMGTPHFAMPSLEALIHNFKVLGVVTQPDKKKGRGKNISFSPIKEMAISNNIPVFQPEKIRNDRELIEILKGMELDFIVVVAFGQILSQEILSIPKFGCVNLHASLLPEYRGAAPINWVLINGEKVTGNTTMLMDVGLDTGDMLLSDEVLIDKDMNYGELHDILKERGGDLLVKTIKGYASLEIKRVPQNKEEVFYAKMINKEFPIIDWNNEALKLKDFVRGLSPSPCARTNYEGKILKIFKIGVTGEISKEEPGKIISSSKEGIKVATLDKNILIEEIQIQGGKRLRVEEYLRGNVINNVILK